MNGSCFSLSLVHEWGWVRRLKPHIHTQKQSKLSPVDVVRGHILMLIPFCQYITSFVTSDCLVININHIISAMFVNSIFFSNNCFNSSVPFSNTSTIPRTSDKILLQRCINDRIRNIDDQAFWVYPIFNGHPLSN